MSLDDLERLIERDHIAEKDVEDARRCMVSLLKREISTTPDTTPSFLEAIAALASDHLPHPNAAAYIIRFLAVDNLVPKSDAANRIAQHIVIICERALPELCKYLGLGNQKQNYDKLTLLRSAHRRICAVLDPLTVLPADVELLVSSRHVVLQALNQSLVKTYCSPFGVAHVRSGFESVLTKFAKLIESTTNYAIDLEDCRATMATHEVFCNDNHNFLTREYFSPFLSAANRALEQFSETARGRFSASLTHRLPTSLTLQKRYPLHEEGREIGIAVPLRNHGPGIGLAARAAIAIGTESEEVVFAGGEIALGNVLPGDFSAVFDALVLAPCSRLTCLVTVSWGETGSLERKDFIFEVHILAQKDDIDWIGLERERPYNTDVAKGAAFVGRSEKILGLANKLLRTPMESVYVTGQKRVGKTSLALAAADFAKAQDGRLECCYILWGEVALGDSRAALKEIGRIISTFIARTLPEGTEVPDLDFENSLAPLARLADVAKDSCPNIKYLVIFDEFDELYPDLYTQGTLAETFFANIRAITMKSNICMILVGGENMPFVMDRQGQKLNRFVKTSLDYFSRDDEWEDFKLLVRKPTEGTIDWDDDAVSEIFNVTNGNPWFAKIVCASVFVSAVKERDSYVTAHEVKRAIAAEVPNFDTNSFAHLWEDGIYKPEEDRAPDRLRRRRVLVAIARTIRRGQALILTNIVANKHSGGLPDSEVLPVLNDFARRYILRERNEYQFVLPIFHEWLSEVGVSRLAGDILGEELAIGVQAAEEAARVRSDEIVSLAKRWPTYQGRAIGTDHIRAWYQQVEGERQQRILFKLLQSVRIFSETQIRERLRTVHSFVRPILPEFVMRRRSDRRFDLIVTYVDGEGKSGQYYASRYAEENSVSQKAVMSPSDFSETLRTYIEKNGNISAIVVVDDIVATGNSLAANLKTFLSQNRTVLQNLNVPIIALALAATADGESKVLSELEKIEWVDFNLRICDPLSGRDFAFGTNDIWASSEERERAKALCTDLGANIYRDNPLGYGGHGLLVVFPDTCPNNSLPILHSVARPSAGRKWFPLFPRLVN